jgi:hypothetical protein
MVSRSRDDRFVDPDVLIAPLASHQPQRPGRHAADRLPLEYRWPDRQLPSEGATRGAIQVPPNGFPVILGPDHPVTGGYPVIGVVTDEDIDKVARSVRTNRAAALVTPAAAVPGLVTFGAPLSRRSW